MSPAPHLSGEFIEPAHVSRPLQPAGTASEEALGNNKGARVLERYDYFPSEGFAESSPYPERPDGGEPPATNPLADGVTRMGPGQGHAQQFP